MIALAVFVLYPITGDQIYLVTGIVRVVFSLASVLLVFAFYENMVNIPKIVSVPLTHLSVVTYGVYLLHPIIYRIVIVALKKNAHRIGTRSSYWYHHGFYGGMCNGVIQTARTALHSTREEAYLQASDASRDGHGRASSDKIKSACISLLQTVENPQVKSRYAWVHHWCLSAEPIAQRNLYQVVRKQAASYRYQGKNDDYAFRVERWR